LLAISMGTNGATFLVQEGQTKSGESAMVWVYQIFEPALKIGPASVVQAMANWKIDCAAHTVASVYRAGYDASDKFVIDTPAEAAKPIVAETSQAYVGKVVCEGVELPADDNIMGYKAAALVARGMIQGAPRQ
jgi:hypothetical protein